MKARITIGLTGVLLLAGMALGFPALSVHAEPELTEASPAFGDVLQTLPEGHGERKDVPIVTGVLDYFPLAIAYVARISKLGNDQHNPGEPLHWARGKSSDHADCVGRHLMQRGTFDADTFADGERVRHTGKAAWRVLALLQEELEAEAGFTPKEGS